MREIEIPCGAAFLDPIRNKFTFIIVELFCIAKIELIAQNAVIGRITINLVRHSG